MARKSSAKSAAPSPKKTRAKKTQAVVPLQKTGGVASLEDMPALKAYITRIGAEQLNLRRYMVKVHQDKYYVERALIRIDNDGNASCADKEFAPTDAESDAIALEVTAQIKAGKWPTARTATEAQYRALQKLLPGAKLFPFYNQSNGDIRMVQERRETDKGKIYVPWALFGDNWESMEPDGALPFFKPKEASNNWVMVHEGAKAADAAANVGKDHPWYDELKKYDHWGIIGGALAPHRADYDELQKANPAKLVYVCDNDDAGHNVISTFSKNWGKALQYVLFDKRFPDSFDMADPIPAELYEKDGRFKKPTLISLMRSGTFATEEFTMDESKRKYHKITKAFQDEWRISIIGDRYINKKMPGLIYNEAQFNNRVQPVSHVENTSRLLKSIMSCKVDRIEYDPSRSIGEYVIEGERIFNCYHPGYVRPEKGSAKPWLDYMEHLIPEAGDRELALKWVATLIACPGIRMTYSMLLISEKHGVGKTTLGEKILAPIVGMHNCSFPNEKDITESQFNDWIAHKRLAVVSEIYAGHSSKAYQNLKHTIADKIVKVNEKYAATYQISNWLHVLASSNSMRALKLQDDDRRWLVPTVTEKLKPIKYWQDLNDWLREDGLGIIVQWASDYVNNNGSVEEGEHSPLTSRKTEVIQESYSPGMRLVREYLEGLPDGDSVWTTDGMLQDFIREKLYNGKYAEYLERPRTIRSLAESLGWKIGKENKGCKALNLAPWRHRVIARSDETAKLMPSVLADLGNAPQVPMEDV